MFEKIRHGIKHSLKFWSKENFKRVIKERGLSFFVILVGWEITEDIIFPALFAWLGDSVNPFFYSLVPVPWLICLNPIAVPVIWLFYCKIFKKQ